MKSWESHIIQIEISIRNRGLVPTWRASTKRQITVKWWKTV